MKLLITGIFLASMLGVARANTNDVAPQNNSAGADSAASQLTSAMAPGSTGQSSKVVGLPVKVIRRNGKLVASDAAARADVVAIDDIMAKYQTDLKPTKAKFQAQVDPLSVQLTAAIADVRKENGWGTDVNYYAISEEWVKGQTPNVKSVDELKVALSKLPVLVPKKVKFGDSGKTISSDAEMLLIYQKILIIQNEYNVAASDIESKYIDDFRKKVTKFYVDVKETRRINGWSNDVVFDPTNKVWVSTK